MPTEEKQTVAKKLTLPSHITKVMLIVSLLAIGLGVYTGYALAGKTAAAGPAGAKAPVSAAATQASQNDSKTFKDFAEGTIQAKPNNGDDYSEGTHLLVRDGQAPVALTSSVVDLSQYVGKKVRVLGETQKALKEGWLMDVGKVEVQ